MGRTFARAIGGAVALFSATATLTISCAPREEASPRRDPASVVLRLAESMPAEHPSARAVTYLAALVQQRSGGRIRIRVYADGSLGTAEQVLAQLQFGGIAMARVNALDLAETVQSLQKYFVPQGGVGYDEVMATLVSDREPIADACLRERLIPLVFYYPDLRCIYSDERRFSSLADFVGVRIGVGESRVVKEALSALGAEPMDLISADTYKSLRSGYIHAREATLSEFILSDDYPFVRYLTVGRYLAAPDVIIISPEVLNFLSTADRKLIVACAQDTYAYQKTLMDAAHEEWAARMVADHKLVVRTEDTFSPLNDSRTRERYGR